jgi:protein-tyrosine phosphatase
MDSSLNIVALCTGNVARSVMLAYMLTTLSEVNGERWQIRSAGTHVVEGSAMSGRTRDALLGIEELGHHRYNAHRSHQVSSDDVEWADIILASEAAHVNYVRDNFEGARNKAVQIHQFVRYAPLDERFATQLVEVTSMVLDAQLDVLDPAGGDDATYRACALELWEMAQVFATVLGD